MKWRPADLVEQARRFEAAIGARVEGAPRLVGDSAREPIEIVHAIVDQVEREVLPAGRGRRVFPFTDVRITLRATGPREQARLEGAAAVPPSLETRIRERLAAAGCDPSAIAIAVGFVPVAEADWDDPDFQVSCARTTVPASAPAARLTLTVTAGTAGHSEYTITGGTAAVGRGTEVRDRAGRLLRTNLVAFVEGGGDVNLSVSRRHARIEWDAASGGFRLHDDVGQERTTVIRDGSGLRVPQGRGLRLQSGDVLALGEARLVVSID